MELRRAAEIRSSVGTTAWHHTARGEERHARRQGEEREKDRLGSLTLQRSSCDEDGVGDTSLRAIVFDNCMGILAAESEA